MKRNVAMYKNGERVMAWVAKIEKIEKHPEADALDICYVGGWKCITKLGEFQEGDFAVYCSIDSWIPHDIAPFLSKGKEPREYNGVQGEKLRTIKLRKQISQGLLLPTSILPQGLGLYEDGEDVSELLNIQKYDPPLPAQLAGVAKGNFPPFIPKTDQERVQNCYKHITNQYNEPIWNSVVIEEKLEGSSMTVYYNNGDTGVCSRNLDLKEDENNSFWKAARQQEIIEKLTSWCERTGRNIAIQGELCGEGVQGNIYKLQGVKFFVFDIYDIDEGSYLGHNERTTILYEIDIRSRVPLIYEGNSLLCKFTLDEILYMSEGKSELNPNQEREGVVVKSLFDPDSSFKIISNRYLMKQD